MAIQQFIDPFEEKMKIEKETLQREEFFSQFGVGPFDPVIERILEHLYELHKNIRLLDDRTDSLISF